MSNPGRPFTELSESGVLWYINRVAFHPRGFAFAIHIDEGGVITGWSILRDGTEVWAFNADDDDEGFARIEQTLKELRDNEVAQ